MFCIVTQWTKNYIQDSLSLERLYLCIAWHMDFFVEEATCFQPWFLTTCEPVLQKSVSACFQDTSFQPVLYVLLDFHTTVLGILTSCLINSACAWEVRVNMFTGYKLSTNLTGVLLDFHATALGILTSCLIDQFSYFAIFNCCLRLVRHALEENKDIWRTSSCSGGLIPKAWIQGWSRQSLVVHPAFVIGLECSCRDATALKLCLTCKLYCLSNRNRQG